jgi:transposase
MEQLNFQGSKINIGFDVHLKSWKVSIMTDNLMLKTFTQPPCVKTLVNYLHNNYPGATYFSAYEAGYCGFWIHYELLKNGINSMVVNPGDIPTTHKEKVQKEDKRDSKKIVRGLANGDLKGIYVPSMHSLEDRSLVRTRDAIVGDVRRYKQRIKSFLMFYGITIPVQFDKRSCWSNNFFKWLKEIPMQQSSGKQSLDLLINQCLQLRQSVLITTKQIYQLSKSDRYRLLVELLITIPGIGILTAMSLLTELEDIKRFRNNDHLCSFIGLSPTSSSSGDNQKIGGITMRANALLRSTLIECAWMSIRKDPALLNSYLKYCKRMDQNKAIVRIAKKLVHRIQFVLKNQAPYQLSKVE